MARATLTPPFANGHGAAFARTFMLNPVMTGALAPSSHRLALAVVAPLRVRPETFVVEIGCGTGVLTEAVFALGLQDTQYLGIELSPVMVSALTARFPSASFLQGSAEHLVRALRREKRMPFLNLRTVKGLLTDEQKKYLMEKFTELLVETEGGGNPEFRKMVWIQIEEEEAKHWQIGELRLTSEFIAGFVQQREARRSK
jgi:4-oxalocrotonate tautomerase